MTPQSPASTASAINADPAEALRLETRPTPTLTLILAGSLSVLCLSIGAAVAVVPVDQVLSANGSLRPQRQTQPLASAEPGVVRTVLVREGQQVKAGQILLQLDGSLPQGQIQSLQQQLRSNRDLQRNEEERLRERIDSLGRRLALEERVLRPLQALAREGGSSMVQVAEQERQVETTRQELADAQRALGSLAFQSAESRSQLQRDLQLQRDRARRISLQAPVAGTVLDLTAQSGQVVTPGEALLKLVPTSTLQADVTVANKDLAYVKPGQRARINLEAYDPSLYGVLEGQVLRVGQDALPATREIDHPHFPVTLALNSQTLEREGQRFELQPGMAVVAQITLEQRTLLQLFFSQFNRGFDAVRRVR
ncbi:HlyD family secretion protein [Synechococcus sp. CBW1006]|uniref:HlyD family secretion protein n=1 Tax=Synechococcus sp. CBW1006 TaxID=1353138 RepID=UPI0018CE3B22|nr:HlyD family efflux transporter periplasmic adaptor subunit [Synechococcus sp. CBW1006]QPN65888.1 HlyD family efflux transporter periplasmic adaptor subunit [Synechococcus sp. CBW1006]